MCYSVQQWADYRKYTRTYNAHISIREFVKLFEQRANDNRVLIPKGMEFPFTHPQSEEERAIKVLIDDFATAQAHRYEQELVKQRARLEEAEHKLQMKETKSARESQRIATKKIEWATGKLADLRRTEPRASDLRIFPGNYANVMIMEDGKRVIKPMRYQCRPAGKPAFYDEKYPGTYNARRDNLEGFWKEQFGHTHGIMVVTTFYENVHLHRNEQRELTLNEEVKNVELEFTPRPAQDMLVACLWSRWTKQGEPDLLSFAAITDLPPPEVSAAGHDRCIIPIKAEHIDAWLTPDPKNLAAQYAILDDRERPYYEHRVAP